MKALHRIILPDGRIKYAGTGQDSWLTLEQAKKLVDRTKGEMIYEYKDYVTKLWEVL